MLGTCWVRNRGGLQEKGSEILFGSRIGSIHRDSQDWNESRGVFVHVLGLRCFRDAGWSQNTAVEESDEWKVNRGRKKQSRQIKEKGTKDGILIITNIGTVSE